MKNLKLSALNLVVLAAGLLPVQSFAYTCSTVPQRDSVYTLSIPNSEIGRTVKITRTQRGVRAQYIRIMSPVEATMTMPTPKIRNYDGPEIRVSLYLNAFNKVTGKVSMKDGARMVENLDLNCQTTQSLNEPESLPATEWERASQGQSRFSPASY